jgi:Ferritin-like domain
MGEVGVSRRDLLTRAGAGGGAGVFALLGATGTQALAAASISDLANVRVVCVGKRIAINWLTRWVNTPKALAGSDTTDLLRAIRSQEQGHFSLLAPLLSGTAPSDDDYTYTFPAGALRSFELAADFALDLEEMLLGLAIGAASTTDDPGVADLLARVVAGDGQHVSAYSVLAGESAVPNGAPRSLTIKDGGDQLSQFISY